MPRKKLPYDRRNKQNRPKRAESEIMQAEGEKRSGSDSNARGGRKQSRLHESHKDQNPPLYSHWDADEHDLEPNNLAGEDHGINQALLPGVRSAYDVKDLFSVLADLTDDELKTILILPEGTRLEQGARYIDLRRLEQGEFVAEARMVAGLDNYYVPKKDTDYVLWNRLNQVETPARLDESGS